MKVILSTACLIAALIFAGTSYFLRKDRLKSAFEYREDERQAYRAQQEAEIRASAHTPEEKELVSFYYDYDEKKERKNFRLGRDVSKYCAWLLAKDYVIGNFGVCGILGLPKKEGEEWVVRCGVGRTGIPTDVFVHAKTGIITCKDHPTIYDAEAFMAHPEVPNQPPEPTPTSRGGSS